jgi:type II secretory pathway pseudopilin PulG
MKTSRVTGMTLIETLVAMGVMTVFMSVAMTTTLRGLKLQKQLESQADMVVETCRLAERVRLDCREAVRIEASGAGKFEVMGRDGLLARYTVEENLVRRASPGSVDAGGTDATYRVIVRSVDFWDETGRSWRPVGGEGSSTGVRLGFDRWQATASCGGAR